MTAAVLVKPEVMAMTPIGADVPLTDGDHVIGSLTYEVVGGKLAHVWNPADPNQMTLEDIESKGE